MHVLAAPDKFKGTATSAEVGAAIVRGAIRAGATATSVLVSDGGDGLLDALGGANRTTTVTGPLGRPVDAAWRRDGDTAVIESARASGLVLAGGRRGNDAVRATSAGTGELLAAAVAAGATRVLLGLGGSACTDGGAGALAALPAAVLDALTSGAVVLEVCCDVTTRFVDAAVEFAPQKGADAAQVAVLTERLARLQQHLLERHGVDVGALPGAGAAGGLAGGLAAVGGTLRPGFDVVAEHVGLAAALAGADLVVTGEGRLDRTSFAGKVVGGVERLASDAGVPVAVVAGSRAVGPADRDVPVRFELVVLEDAVGRDRAYADTAGCVEQAVFGIVSRRRPG